MPAARADLPAAKRSEAKAHFEAGQRAFDVGKFDEAAKEFVATYEMIGDPLLLYNIAQAYRLGEKPKEALFFYKRYVSRVPDSPLHKEVEKRIDELNTFLSLRKSTTEAQPTHVLRPKDGQPELDNPPVNDKPVTPPPDNPPDKPAKPVDTPPSKPPENPPPQTEGNSGRKLMLAGIGVAALGVVAVAVGAAMSVLAGARSSDLEQAAAMHKSFDADLQSIESKGKMYDNVSYAMYAVGGVAAAAGVVLIVLGKKQSEAGPTAQLAPLASPQAVGLSLSGRF
jgi:iron complex outermembrane receptor protein